MSVSLASHPAQDLLATHAGGPTLLAGDPFAVGPGALALLLLLGVVLLAAIGQVLALVWAVVRAALPVLGTLLLGLAVVALVGMTAVKQPSDEPVSPAPTASPSTPSPAHRAPPGRRRASPTVPPSSLAPLGVPTPR
jgi:hypothetical protein